MVVEGQKLVLIHQAMFWNEMHVHNGIEKKKKSKGRRKKNMQIYIIAWMADCINYVEKFKISICMYAWMELVCLHDIIYLYSVQTINYVAQCKRQGRPCRISTALIFSVLWDIPESYKVIDFSYKMWYMYLSCVRLSQTLFCGQECCKWWSLHGFKVHHS